MLPPSSGYKTLLVRSYQNILGHIPEERHVYIHHRDNLKSHMNCILLDLWTPTFITSTTKIPSPLKPTGISPITVYLLLFRNRWKGFNLRKGLWGIFSLLPCPNGFGALRGEGGEVMKLIIYLHTISRLRIIGTSSPRPYKWCLCMGIDLLDAFAIISCKNSPINFATSVCQHVTTRELRNGFSRKLILGSTAVCRYIPFLVKTVQQ
jgi:hypothetical protein